MKVRNKRKKNNCKIYSYLSELLLLAILWSSVDSFGFCRMLVFSGDSSRPKRSCITLDLFECPTLELEDVDKLPNPPPPSLLPVPWTMLVVVVVVVTSAVLFESCCCCCNCTVGFFVPGLSSNSDRSK